MTKYADRVEAGTILAKQLEPYLHQENTIVLALPRGGVPVAYEIAQALSLPLDILLVRKLGVPHHKELAFGAIATGGTVFFNESLLDSLNLSKAQIDKVIDSEQQELKRRETVYRGDRPLPDLKDKTIILVDDGVATGATARVAIKALRQQQVEAIVLAVPVCAEDTYQELLEEVDELVCPLTPTHFYAVGLWYEIFAQTSDAEVTELLKLANS